MMDQQHDAPPDGKLAENIVHFGRALRAAGLRVGTGTVVDAIRAVEAAGIGERADFYWVLHAVFVKRREDHVIFDQAFRIFWRKRALLERMMAGLLPPNPAVPGRNEDEVSARVAEALLTGNEQPQTPRSEIEVDARLTMSSREVLQRKDFEQMSAAEIARARGLIARMVLPDDRVMTRRLAPSARGRHIDTRRSLRASLRAGGGVIDLKRLRHGMRHPPVVALLDISGSMTQYSRMMLHFLHALTQARRRVSTFVFGTRLTNVTRHLRARDPDEALRRCSNEVADWAGGTRIAACLHEFNRRWARRVLGQGAVVLLVTDGLERDEGGRLGFEVDRLRLSCRRLVWLNPLLRYEGFEAKAGGIRAMLPRVDEFRPVHSLEAMADLVAALDARRPGYGAPGQWLKEAS